METKKVKQLLMATIVFSFVSLSSQTYQTKLIKQVNITYSGVTDTVDLMPIVINTNGNAVVSGNQKMNSTQYNASTIDQLSTGVTNWISQYNSSNQKAFITANCKDALGNIYTAGAIRTNTTNGIDFLVMKLNSAGVTQWVYTYNGPNSTNDVASGVCVDPAGNVFVTGASDGSGSNLIDYATIMIDNTGNQQWCTRYNYNNSIDVPTGIIYDPYTNEVVVSGSSGLGCNNRYSKCACWLLRFWNTTRTS